MVNVLCVANCIKGKPKKITDLSLIVTNFFKHPINLIACANYSLCYRISKKMFYVI